MKAPKTCSVEDVVEINTHGGIVPTNKVLQLLIKNVVEWVNVVNLLNAFKLNIFK